MRNPERIPTILKAIEEVWRQHPDWRLGQLLFNALRGHGHPGLGKEQVARLLYYQEDEKLLEDLQALEKHIGASRPPEAPEQSSREVPD